MWKFLGYFILFGMVAYLIQLALLVGLFVACVVGMIFRPRETIGVVTLLGLFSLLHKFPVPTLIGLGILLLISLTMKAGERAAAKRRRL